MGLIVVLACAASSQSQAAIISFSPDLDNSIYSENDNSNGAGDGIFVGRTAAGGGLSLRRALVRFDVAGNVPAGATINSVTLRLRQIIRGPLAGSETIELRPVSMAWGEGTSSGVGTGGAPTANDATWNFRFFNTTPWTNVGGDFGGVSGTTVLGTTNGFYFFNTQAGMVADVQSWLNNPASNFGWLLKYDNEVPNSNARQFGSRENPNTTYRPFLTVEYSVVPEPTSCLLVSSALFLFTLRRTRNALHTRSS